jgi:hypothetical protein
MMHDHHPSKPEVHGMLILGEKTLYLSHLPMAHPPHNVQAIMEATFGTHQQEAYVKERQKTPTEFYTLAPERFVMPDQVATGAPPPPHSPFRGTVSRGVFDMGGTPITSLGTVDVRVTNIIYFQRLNPGPPPSQSLEYLLFGKMNELFLAHLITTASLFDHVLQVNVLGHTFSDEDLRRGVRITIPGRADAAESGIDAGEQVQGEARAAGQVAPLAIQVEAIAKYYDGRGSFS